MSNIIISENSRVFKQVKPKQIRPTACYTVLKYSWFSLFVQIIFIQIRLMRLYITNGIILTQYITRIKCVLGYPIAVTDKLIILYYFAHVTCFKILL